MAIQKLTELVSQLTPAEQTAVEQFIDYLKSGKQSPSPFDTAIEEFISEHPDLLRRLAQ